MEQENQNLESKTEEELTFKKLGKYLSKSILSPAVIGTGKVIAASIVSDFSLELTLDHPLELYLISGGVFDICEMLYRVYEKDEFGYWDGVPKEGILFSCLERHLFYDIPKGVYNTIKHLVKKE